VLSLGSIGEGKLARDDPGKEMPAATVWESDRSTRRKNGTAET